MLLPLITGERKITHLNTNSFLERILSSTNLFIHCPLCIINQQFVHKTAINGVNVSFSIKKLLRGKTVL